MTGLWRENKTQNACAVARKTCGQEVEEEAEREQGGKDRRTDGQGATTCGCRNRGAWRSAAAIALLPLFRYSQLFARCLHEISAVPAGASAAGDGDNFAF
eukprot:6188202-Pleurochrysis_carterae.AAC.4